MASKMRKKTLHENERPVAMLTSLTANSNRDPKKQKKPYTLDQFCLYQPQEDKDIPSYKYGSAALSAQKMGLLPNWSFFCFKELVAAASDTYRPSNPILLAEDALLLHPVKTDHGWKGMLIACESAGGQVREFMDSEGKSYKLAVPIVDTKYVAYEDIILS